jgi:preprotein translocase subunit SecD
MQKQRVILGLIIVLLIGALAYIFSGPMRLGLDLQGGSQLTIQVKSTKEHPNITEQDIDAVKKVVENRIDGLGVSEAVIQAVGNNQVAVQLPGVTDPEQAERVLGGTAQLDFREQKPGTEGNLTAEYQSLQGLKLKQKQLQLAKDKEGMKTNQAAIVRQYGEIGKLFEKPTIVGKNLKGAEPQPTGAGDAWNVAIRFDDMGAQQFAKLTKNLAGTGRSIGIFLDNDPISTPVVGPEFAATGITGGNAAESSQDLAVQLRGGSLPVPVEIVENRTVGATLGQDSIRSSIYAGIGGLLLVLLFMGVYYRLPGIAADLALVFYTIISLAAFKVFGVTLTLPGIAGFILSIGMAVDSNVLIFERTREEIRDGKTLYKSVEAGFDRAFSSIIDSHVTSIISCLALFFLGSGLVKGFALTLGIGVAISLFTSYTCTRTFLLLMVLGIPALRQKPQLFAPKVPTTNV